MGEQLGALVVPVPAVVVGQSTGDPLLDTLLSFFTAVLNAKAITAWRSIYREGGSSPLPFVVKKTHGFDPEDGGLLSSEFPALFLWRSAFDAQIQLADDHAVRDSTLAGRWVWPIEADENKRARRAAFINAILAPLTIALVQGRDPAWVVAGDPDSTAATLGSVLLRHAALMHIRMGGARKSMLKSTDDQFPTVQFDVSVREHLTRTLVPMDVAATGTLTTADTPSPLVTNTGDLL